ncbi:MAG: cytochrome c oxidase subunit II [Bryobacteraceae bacterium]|nr:cytochrome c oxidase subunit II [Bryobacteraceae bacterium]
MDWLFPIQASSVAPDVDNLYWFLIVVCGGLATILAVLIVGFAIRYHRKFAGEIPLQNGSPLVLEVGWSVGTLLLFLVMFFWGARLYSRMSVPPSGAIEIYAIGKRWMWKLQHPGGQREMNELHIPTGTPVRITLTSQDVIHSFFIPAFRVKQDAVPGRYTTMWFTATKAGRYHLFCTEYCGLNHSRMTGWVYAMEPASFAQWLTSGAAEGSLSSLGGKAFHQYGCSTCHNFDGSGPGPSLAKVYGSRIRIEGQADVTADDSYIRESILNARAKVVYGFAPVMPAFQGQIPEEDVINLIEYIKSLREEPE